MGGAGGGGGTGGILHTIEIVMVKGKVVSVQSTTTHGDDRPILQGVIASGQLDGPTALLAGTRPLR